eukprot:COSAG01_NODE_57274_length_313_cov_0.864486_1_plen_32_part_01
MPVEISLMLIHNTPPLELDPSLTQPGHCLVRY